MLDLNTLSHETLLARQDVSMRYARTMAMMARIYLNVGSEAAALQSIAEGKKAFAEYQRVTEYLDMDKTQTIQYKMAA